MTDSKLHLFCYINDKSQKVYSPNGAYAEKRARYFKSKLFYVENSPNPERTSFLKHIEIDNYEEIK